MRLQKSGHPLRLVLVSFALLAVVGLSGAKKRNRPIRNPKYDPTAERVELFDAMKAESLSAVMIPQNSLHGNLVIENKTDKPLTVELPESFVGVHVLKQVGGGGGGQAGGGGGQAQSAGGGAGGGGNFGGGGGGQGGGGQGGGFFSIPAERKVVIPYKSVCLEHGKNEPHNGMRYRVVPTEKYTKDPILQEMIWMVGTGRLDPKSAQAATWHITDNMSWQQLANKTQRVLGQGTRSFFTYGQVSTGRGLANIASVRAREKAEKNGTLEEFENAISSRGSVRSLKPRQ